jgi:hypothetical protein
MLRAIPILEDWIKAMWSEAQRRLEDGEKVTHVKLVAKRPQRRWIDDEQARRVFENDMMLAPEEFEDRRLKSPAQIEKIVGKKLFKPVEESLVIKQSSGNTIALDTDTRPEVLALPGSEFMDSEAPNEANSQTVNEEI